MINLSFRNPYKDLSFNYSPNRGQQLNSLEPSDGEGDALDPLDFQQSWNTDMLNRPFIDKEEKNKESLDTNLRDGLTLWI